MKKLLKQIWFGAVLIVFSVSTYYIHYLIFHDSHHIFIYLVGDIAFVFIEVLMVTMIIHKVFENMEKQSRMKKLNMVIGVFFSEMGTTLLSHFSDLDLNLDEIRRDLIVSSNWTDTDFLKVAEKLKRYPCRIEPSKLSVDEISCYLAENHGLMLQMMGNPNLMEHETFTRLLQSVLHLSEEFRLRESINDLPEEDINHIAGDIDRAYKLLVHEWVAYMKHLKENSPYLFSLAIRTNPFDKNASVVIGDSCITAT